MLDQNLIDYVKNALEQGHNPGDIRQVLLGKGWQEADVNQAISLLQIQKQAPVAPSAPSAPTAAPVTPTQPQTYAHAFSGHSYSARKPQTHYVSPYSTLLAVVLFVFLWILVNRILTDLRGKASDVNGQLIFDALVVVPFLLVASLIHMSIAERKEKFLVLTYPYYLVSGWLLLRLLWHVSAYILSTSATYGVYIVLVLVIAVLTGIVFFIQKFIKNQN